MMRRRPGKMSGIGDGFVRRGILIGLLLVAGAGSVIAAAWLWTGCPLVVVVRNNTSGPIVNVAVLHTGGKNSVAAIAAGTEARICVHNFRSESDLTLEYLDRDGTKRGGIVAGYVESGYRGRVVVDVSPAGWRVVEDTVKPY
jgi:hypothetical protein